MLGRVKLDNTLLTCDKGNFHQITARTRNRSLVTVVRNKCTTTVPPASHTITVYGAAFYLNIKFEDDNFRFVSSTLAIV